MTPIIICEIKNRSCIFFITALVLFGCDSGAGPAQAASLGASVGVGASRGVSVSVGAAAGSVGAGAAAHVGAASAVSGSVASPAASAGVGATASTASTSAGAHVSTPAASVGAAAGVSSGSSVASGGASVGHAGAAVAGVRGSSPASGFGSAASTPSGANGGSARSSTAVQGQAGYGSPGLNSGGTVAANNPGLSSQAAAADQAIGSFPVQDIGSQPADPNTYVLRGLSTLGFNQKVDCSSEFCIAHLRHVSRTPTRIMIARDRLERWRDFDEVIMSAEAGNPDAEFLVAEVLSGGHGVPANIPRAAIWYTRAAEHGHTLAVARLNKLRAVLAKS